MTELAGFLWLAAGLAALGSGAVLVACTLRLRSPLEFVLAAYLVAWGWIVAVTLALSPAALLTRASLSVSLGVGLLGAVLGWHVNGRPPPPSFRLALREVRIALRRPEIFVLALAVSLGAAYSVALAFLTPVNDGDALAYHVARAAFWRQEHGLGYVDGAVDVRINAPPPNAEIGQLATMLLSGSDRYVALPQLFAYGALVLCVAAVARRTGRSAPEALFGALAFATLPVVAVQASGALNDLVVASFLAISVLFALRTGWGPTVLLALGLGLALGTKLTTVLALPTLALVVALARPRREWLRLGLAGLAGMALGSAWYVVNVLETGDLDGGLTESDDQSVGLSAPALITNSLRYALDLVDRSGAPSPYETLFLVAAIVLAAIGLQRLRHSASHGAALIAAAALTALPYLAEGPVGVLQDAIVRVWAALGRPETAPFERGWNLNVEADPVLSWFGPLGSLLLAIGTIAIVVLWHRKRLPGAALGLALAPWALLLTLMTTITWDPFRGRFLVVGFAFAAATWGVLLRFRVVAAVTAALGTTTLALALANYLGKPSGLDAAWSRGEPSPASLRSIWRDDRAGAQARLRVGKSERKLFGYVERKVPADARLVIAARENDLLSPYFGSRLTRTVELIRPQGGSVSADGQWLVLSPGSSVDRCREDWRRELQLETGWRLERRIAADGGAQVTSECRAEGR
jgi:4-amino-4-deoxy-L-arabinose transferase-like glycosyltransferase